MTINITRLSNDDLIANTRRAAANERHATYELVALLAEIEARELYLGLGFSSLFAYCTRVLHLSEEAAYRRIEAARVALRFPVILDRLASGELTRTTSRCSTARVTRVRGRSNGWWRSWRRSPTSLQWSGGCHQ